MNRSRYTPPDPYSDTATGIRTPALIPLLAAVFTIGYALGQVDAEREALDR